MISFKCSQFPKPVILFAVNFYARYSVSYRDLEEILAERGVVVDHATLNRWIIKYSPVIALEAHRRKGSVANFCLVIAKRVALGISDYRRLGVTNSEG